MKTYFVVYTVCIEKDANIGKWKWLGDVVRAADEEEAQKKFVVLHCGGYELFCFKECEELHGDPAEMSSKQRKRWRAFDDGFAALRAGWKPESNPFGPGTPKHSAWAEGFYKAQMFFGNIWEVRHKGLRLDRLETLFAAMSMIHWQSRR